MFRRVLIAVLLAGSLLTGVACKKNKKATNPLAHVNSKQPDKVLYDRAMDAMKERKFDAARLTLQTLISTYPESEFVARAKLAVGEAWYQEGSTAALAQAETEFRDFITFFPNMAEAAEAQLKIADIHYREMGKPDRDFTHALRAQEEYRLLLMQYPDSKLTDTARLRLLEVQEVLAEREFRIARLYFLRSSLLAAIARAKTLSDTYPLYSRADEALFILGQAYEQQAEQISTTTLSANMKKDLSKGYLDNAERAYHKIVIRYPAMPRYPDARHRLTALGRPIPTPTPEAIAVNKRELASRTATTRYRRFMHDMSKKPDLSGATKVGEPSLLDPKETDAAALARELTNSAMADLKASQVGKGKVAIETVAEKTKITENQAAPRSSDPALSPNDIPKKAPDQLNESTSDSSDEEAANSSSSSSTNDDSKDASSSRKEKKKHRKKIPVPF